MFSIRFWVQTLISTVFVMLMIYAVKKVSTKYNIPVLSTVSEGV